MENGADVVVEERETQLSSVQGDAGDLRSSKDEKKDSEENEVFEEAMEAPPLPPPREVASDLQDVSVLVAGNGAMAAEVVADGEDGDLGHNEGEKFVESEDVQVGDTSSMNQEISSEFVESKKDLTSDASAEKNGGLGRNEGEKFVEPVVVQVSDHTSENQEEVGSEKFVESKKDLINDPVADEKRSPALEDNGLYVEEVELSAHERLDELLDGQLNHQDAEDQEASAIEEKLGLLSGSDDVLIDGGAVPFVSDGVEVHSVAGEKAEDGLEGSSMPEDYRRLTVDENGQELVNIISETRDSDIVDSDTHNVLAFEGPGSIESVELVKNEIDANHDKSKEHIHHEDKVQPVDEVPVVSVGLSKEQATNEKNEERPPKYGNGFVTNRYAPVEIEKGSSLSHAANGTKDVVKVDDLDISRSERQQKVSEDVHKESLLLGKSGGPRSIDSMDNGSSRQTAPSASSGPGNAGGSALPSRPAGLGSSAPLLEPSGRNLQQPRGVVSDPQTSSPSSDEPSNDDAEENDETREKLQMIRVKFLRLARRLGQTPHNVVVAQVLYRLGLAEQLRRNTNRPGVFGFERASVMAEQLEASGQEPLDFSCTIMVIGKTGVGKSATINSIFDEVRLPTDAFQLGTKKVQEIVGVVQGIKVRIIDTPGLLSSSSDQRRNEKILHSVKRFINKTIPDIVLYFDRLDMQSRDFGDVPLLRTVTDIFGASIWFNAIVVLTHAASAPPEGPGGNPLSYEMFVTQRSHVVQQAIRQAAGDVRLMNPVSLVENHSACRMNRAGQRVLPNGQVWKPQLLLLSFASKILAEANMLLKLQDSPPGKPFGVRQRIPPLPFLLSSLLQSRPQLKLPDDQVDDDDALDASSDETSDSDDSSEYNDLPPFKPLTKSQLEKLTKAQKKAYFEELDYREKLFYRKQLKEEKRRRRQMKKMADMAKDLPNDNNSENLEDENGGPASIPVPLPDFVLPNSFDSDYPSHRYRILDSSNQWLVRPVLDSQGWDHDIGYEGLNVERLFVIKDKIPMSVSGQLTKDKKECTLQMEVASSIKHSEGKASSLGLDLQTVGKDVAYTLRGETRFKNFRRNNTAAGVSVTFLGDSVSTGLKLEDKLMIGKRFRVLLSGGAMTGRGEVAYGGRLEATLRDKDYPIGRALSTLALSVVDWHGDLAIGCNVQSQLPLGRGDNVIVHGNLSNKGTGQVGIRLNSSEHLQIALLALVPIFRNVKRMLLDSSQPT